MSPQRSEACVGQPARVRSGRPCGRVHQPRSRHAPAQRHTGEVVAPGRSAHARARAPAPILAAREGKGKASGSWMNCLPSFSPSWLQLGQGVEWPGHLSARTLRTVVAPRTWARSRASPEESRVVLNVPHPALILRLPTHPLLRPADAQQTPPRYGRRAPTTHHLAPWATWPRWLMM